MKKVAIVGVEGSGKTVMLAGLGDLYKNPDDNGFFLGPKNFSTASYVAEKIERMRKGEWPGANVDDSMQGLDWTLRRRKPGSRGRPDDICEVSFLDYPGEVYRTAFGINSIEAGAEEPKIVESLKRYIREADDLIVLINLCDIIVNGCNTPRVQEAMWITNEILSFALRPVPGRKTLPRAAIVLSQADSYADTIKSCGGVKGVLAKYLPHVASNYGWLDLFAVSAVDKTKLDDDGNIVPEPDFQSDGLKPVMEWIVAGRLEEKSKKRGCGFLMAKVLFLVVLCTGILLYLKTEWRAAIEIKILDKLEACHDFICRNDAKSLLGAGVAAENGDPAYAFKLISAAAHGGNAQAQFMLGWMYANGRGGERDDEMAVQWYRRSAAQGNAEAENSLGLMYEEGRGVVRDVARAESLYRKSAEKGCLGAKKNLERLTR